MKKSVKIITGILGVFMLVPGLAKFFEPFKTMLAVQIWESELPYPTLSQIGAQGTEIAVGLVLIFLAFYWNKLGSAISNKIFLVCHALIIATMLVALYVHFHPNVPAEVLPFESKPPYLTSFYIILTFVNIYLSENQKKIKSEWRNR